MKLRPFYSVNKTYDSGLYKYNKDKIIPLNQSPDLAQQWSRCTSKPPNTI